MAGPKQATSDRIEMVPLSKIKLAKNSRLNISNEELAGLMQTIKEMGMLEPIGLHKTGSKYEVIYGNRRFLAYSKLGRKVIPAMVFEKLTQAQKDLMNLAENVQRKNIGLIEVGRYCQLLLNQGLTRHEMSVRLGVPVNYIDSCLKAYSSVPTEFRKNIVDLHKGRRKKQGEIALTDVKAIHNAVSNHRLSGDQKKNLYKHAQSDKFNPKLVNEYAVAAKQGKKDLFRGIDAIKTVGIHLTMTEKEYDRLWIKHIEEGPFHSFSSFIAAVLAGQKSEKIKLLKSRTK